MKICELAGTKEPRELSFIKKAWNAVMNPLGSFLSLLVQTFVTVLITPVSDSMADRGRKTAEAIGRAAGRGERTRKRLERVRKMGKLFRIIADTAVKFFRTIADAVCNFASPAAWIIWGVTVLLIVVVLSSLIFGRYGSFNGELRFDMNTMRSLNQDEERYTNLLNTAALRESFYEEVSDTSIWQTFTVRDGKGGTQSLADIVTSSVKSLFGGESSDGNSYVSQAAANGIKLYDTRYTVTDADKNPAAYLMQADSLGTYSDAYGMTSYFRDYYGREENFTLSADFLYELNRWIYQTDSASSEYDKIVYPEAFTQPVSYVYDYLRIQTDKLSSVYGESYVYVTQRVTLEDIQDSGSDYYEQYAMEGIIVSAPSDIVYDYAVLETDDRAAREAGTGSSSFAYGANVSRYAVDTETVSYGDGTYEDTQKLLRLYWIVNPAYTDRHMGEELSESTDEETWEEIRGHIAKGSGSDRDTGYRCNDTNIVISKDCTDPYIGPFYGLEVDGDGTISFAGKLTDSVTVNGQEITLALNQYPSKHYQLAPITDEDGNIQIYSRNLFNKTYIRLPAVRAAYRNSDEYWENFESFVMEDLSRAPYSDKQLQGYGTVVNGKLVYVESRDEQTGEITYTVEPSDWDERKCSILYACWGYHNLTNSVTAVMDNLLGAGDNAVEDVNAIGVYEILAAYEDYLTTHGTEGVEWEYKYYTSTTSQQEETASAIKGELNLFGWKLEDVTGAADWFDTTTDIYRDTYDALVSLRSDRTLSTEYTPVAELTSEEWGWKYAGRDAGGNVLLTKVYGEASYQLPAYSTAESPAGAEELRAAVEAEAEEKGLGVCLWKTSAYKDFVESMDTDSVFAEEYAEIIYGEAYFGYVWEQEDGRYYLNETPEETALDYASMITAAKKAYEEALADYALDSVGQFVLGSGIELPVTLSVGLVSEAVSVWKGEQTASDAMKDTYDRVMDALFGWASEKDAAIALAETAARDCYDDYSESSSAQIEDITDIQNKDKAWNPDAAAYRPNEDGFMEEAADDAQTGRVTEQDDPDNWLAMELKSVRDYGLGSVLSYLETRKVTYISALALTETPDTAGMKAWFEAYYAGRGYTGDVLEGMAQRAIKGYYPSELLDEEIDGAALREYVRALSEISVTGTGSGDKEWQSLYDCFGAELGEDDLKRIAHGLNALQGTGESVYEYSGLKFTVSYVSDADDDSTLPDGGFVLMVGDASAADGWKRTNITVVMPYLSRSFTEEYLQIDTLFDWTGTKAYTDFDALNEKTNQFFDPQGYYLTWFDCSEDATLIEQTVALLQNTQMVSAYDNRFSKQVREILSGVHSTSGKVVTDGDETMADRLASAMEEAWAWVSANTGALFGTDNTYSKYKAGLYMTSDQWTALFNTVADTSRELELIDSTATGKVYLISEAVTFIGNFLYTYDTRLLVAGSLDGDASVISGMAYADRYYAVSNYIFKAEAEATTVVWSDTRYAEYTTNAGVLTFCRSILDRTGKDSDEITADDLLEDPTFLTWAYQLDPALVSAGGNVGTGAGTAAEWEDPSDTFVSAARDAIKGSSVLTAAGEDYLDEISDFAAASNFYILSYGAEDGTGYTFSLDGTALPEELWDAMWEDGNITDAEACAWSGSGDYETDLMALTAGDIRTVERICNPEGLWDTPITASSDITVVWCCRYGAEVPYEYVSGTDGQTPAVYVDSLGEIKELYGTLVGNGHAETANKLLLGIKVYEEYNDISAGTENFDAVSNRKGAADAFAHFYSDVDGSGSLYDSNARNDSDYLWAQFASSAGLSAAYGDTDNHYASLKTVNNYLEELCSNRGQSIALTEKGIMKDGVLTEAGWQAMTDTDGNYNDVGLAIAGWLTSASDVSLLTDEDLEYIRDAVLRMYGETYSYDGNVPIGTDGICEEITLYAGAHEYDSQYGTKYFWNKTVHGTAYDSTTNDASIVFDETGDRVPYCKVNYVKSPSMRSGALTNSDISHSLFGVPIAFENVSAQGGISAVSQPMSETVYWAENGNGKFVPVAYGDELDISAARYGDETADSPYVKIWELPPVVNEVYNRIVYGRTMHVSSSVSGKISVGLNMADRSSYGTLMPTYTRLYGYKKQIAPTQTGAYFNEEVYSDWMNRISAGEVSSGKETYLAAEHERALSYLYDYLTEFETYLPLGVMSDADLWVRGGEAYTSIAANTNRAFSYTGPYLSMLANDLQTSAWQQVFANYASASGSMTGYASLVNDIRRMLENRTGMQSGDTGTVTQDAMAQYIAGLIETTYGYGPFIMISYYNRAREIPIEYSEENYDAIRDGMALTCQYGADSGDEAKTVVLLLEDGTKREYELLFVGAGAVPCYETEESGSTVWLTTDDTAEQVIGFGTRALMIRDGYDERLDAEKALEYVSVKFGKLLYKYGNVSSACMAYFYGERYWDAMLAAAKAQGISTGPEWANDDADLVRGAVESVLQSSVSEGQGIQEGSDILPVYAGWSDGILTQLYTAEVTEYALEYVPDAEDRLLLLKSTSSPLGAAALQIGTKASVTQDLYASFKAETMDYLVSVSTYEDGHPLSEKNISDVVARFDLTHIDDVCNMYGVDTGLVMAVIEAASGGDPMSGFCEVVDVQGSNELSKIYKTDRATRMGLFGLAGPAEGMAETVQMTLTVTEIDTDALTSAGSDIQTAVISEPRLYHLYEPASVISLYYSSRELDLRDFNANATYTESVIGTIRKFFSEDMRFSETERDGITYPTALEYAVCVLTNAYDKYDGDVLSVLYEYFYGSFGQSLTALKKEAARAGYGANWYRYFEDRNGDDNYIVETLRYYDATIAGSSDRVISATEIRRAAADDVPSDTIYTVVSSDAGASVTKEVIKTIETADEDSAPWHLLTAYNVPREWIIADGQATEELLNLLPSCAGSARISWVTVDDTETVRGVENGVYRFVYDNLTDDAVELLKALYEGAVEKATVYLDSYESDGVIYEDMILGGSRPQHGLSPCATVEFEEELSDSSYTRYVLMLVDISGTPYSRVEWENSFMKDGALGWVTMDGRDYMLVLTQVPCYGNITLNDCLYVDIHGCYWTDTLSGSSEAAEEEKAKQGYAAARPVAYMKEDGSVVALNEEYEQYATLTQLFGKSTLPVKLLSRKRLTVTVRMRGTLYLNGSGKIPVIDITKQNLSLWDSLPSALKAKHDDVLKSGAAFLEADSQFPNAEDACECERCDVTIRYKPLVSGSGIIYGEEGTAEIPALKTETVWRIHYDNEWPLTVDGNNLSLLSLFSDTSSFNEYTADKVAQQNSGITVYDSSPIADRKDVKLIIVGYAAAEDNLLTSADELSVMSFFGDGADAIDSETQRSWFGISTNENLMGKGQGTPNEYPAGEISDFPVLCMFGYSPTGEANTKNKDGEYPTLEVDEWFGRGINQVTGTSCLRSGTVFRYPAYSAVTAVFSGKVVELGYNAVYGNYIVVESGAEFGLLAAVNGDRYNVTGMRAVYGYLDDSVSIRVGDSVLGGQEINGITTGVSGGSTGDQLYFELRISAEILDSETDECIGAVQWEAVDPAPYFTSTWKDGTGERKFLLVDANR